jgi:hypothetical protein
MTDNSPAGKTACLEVFSFVSAHSKSSRELNSLFKEAIALPALPREQDFTAVKPGVKPHEIARRPKKNHEREEMARRKKATS